MLRRSNCTLFAAATRMLRSGGGGDLTNKDHPIQPEELGSLVEPPQGWSHGPVLGRLMDQNVPLYDDTVTGIARWHWQEPARVWNMFEADDTLVLQEHDREEWNEKPYVGVSHLYEPPLGSEERPMRIETQGNPGDHQVLMCFGNCAPHVPQSTFYMMMKGYAKNKCPMCQQWFYIHNRPWLVMHPDWTDEPAADEGPAYTFAEIESEFDRDFHEFSVYLNAE
eukprot:GILI01006930.1.p1 GENE.GILI01006930.1~~GILI01006930.1.p1  ORF type:complete len:234 (-),score=54.24 GILI01006930.1:155-823(-)